MSGHRGLKARNAAVRTGVALVGLGMGAKPHALALNELEDMAEVRCVYSPTESRRREFAAAYDFDVCDSLDAIVSDSGIEVVLLITPPNARMEIVKKLAEAGKHILMEKPVERTTVAAEEIVAVCEDADIRLGIVFQQRFCDGAQILKQLITLGGLGALGASRLTVPWWREQSYYDASGRGTYARDGGGALISQAIHTLDLLLWLTGPVAEVQAIAATTILHRMEAEDFVGAGIRYPDGTAGFVSATTAAFPGESERICLDFELASTVLEAGALTIHWRDGRVERARDRRLVVAAPPLFENRQAPWPSCHRTLTRSPRRLRKRTGDDRWGSRFSVSCTTSNRLGKSFLTH